MGSKPIDKEHIDKIFVNATAVVLVCSFLLILCIGGFLLWQTFRFSGFFEAGKSDRSTTATTYQLPFPLGASKNNPETTTVVSTQETTTTNVSNVKELFPLVTALVLFAGFAATIYQLRQSHEQNVRAERWKHSEYVTAELRTFTKDSSVINVKRLLEAVDAAYDARLMLYVPESVSDTGAKDKGDLWISNIPFVSKPIRISSEPASSQSVSFKSVPPQSVSSTPISSQSLSSQSISSSGYDEAAAPGLEGHGELKQWQVSVTRQQMLNAWMPNPQRIPDLCEPKNWLLDLTDYDTAPAEDPDREDPSHLQGDGKWMVLAGKHKHTALETQIAYEMDAFFVYLIHFHKMVRDGVLTYQDLHPYLHYWLSLIWQPSPAASRNEEDQYKAEQLRLALIAYVQRYYYDVLGEYDEKGEINHNGFISSLFKTDRRTRDLIEKNVHKLAEPKQLKERDGRLKIVRFEQPQPKESPEVLEEKKKRFEEQFLRGKESGKTHE